MGYHVLRRFASALAVLGMMAAPTVLAPQAASVAYECDYPDDVKTKVSLTLARSVGEYGDRNSATATVTSGVGTPTGKVRFRLNGTYHAVRLTGGTATYQLPRYLPAGRTYSVQAFYTGDCGFRKSVSGIKYYTVIKARIYNAPRVLNGRAAKFNADFTFADGATAPNGQAWFRVLHHGEPVRFGQVDVRGGHAYANLRNLPRGRYVLQVRYVPRANYDGIPRAVKFRVTGSR